MASNLSVGPIAGVVFDKTRGELMIGTNRFRLPSARPQFAQS